MVLLSWLLRAFIFFTLFAFALNNQQPATVHWFFGVEWRAPMVIVVLAAFAAGCTLGVLAMLPGWWRQRRAAQPLRRATDRPATPGTGAGPAVAPQQPAPAEAVAEVPPRLGA